MSSTLRAEEGEDILDAGCGPGLVIEKIAEQNKGKGISITGLDFNERMIRQARNRCKNLADVTLRVADLNGSLQFPDSSFHKVICCNTLYALEDPHKVVSEFHRVLKRGGAVIIANPKPKAGENALIKEHIAALRSLTPLYRRIYHILVLLLLVPIHLAVVTINKVIIQKGRSGEYHFLPREDLQQLLQEVGFSNIDIASCYADQDWLARADK